ncbi:MAG: exodeoxyribonuclease VII large subunit [Bacteroidales bacterium]|nr:exodeoxyribonuclease VII large subunit [Bacteroidales bacterium]
MWQAINKQTMNRCKLEENALNVINASIRQQGRRRLSTEDERLLYLLPQLKMKVSGFLLHNKTQLDFNAKTVSLLDPVNVLRRGYSITYSEGKLVSSIKNVKTGASLKTILQDGELISIINEKTEHHE